MKSRNDERHSFCPLPNQFRNVPFVSPVIPIIWESQKRMAGCNEQNKNSSMRDSEHDQFNSVLQRIDIFANWTLCG